MLGVRDTALIRANTEVPGVMGRAAFTPLGLSSETLAQVDLPVQSAPSPELC